MYHALPHTLDKYSVSSSDDLLLLVMRNKITFTPSLWPGVLCNSQCPDKLQLGELTSNNWHTGTKVFIALLIIGLAVVCIIVKVVFRLWLFQLEKKQEEYLKQFSDDNDTEVRQSSDYTPQVECLSVCVFERERVFRG